VRKKDMVRNKHPNLPTYQKLRALIVYRRQYMKENGTPPTWTSACRKIGIEPRTVKKYVPELSKEWDNENFYF
jgi:hypothetical protein